jgi:hypothetical protein
MKEAEETNIKLRKLYKYNLHSHVIYSLKKNDFCVSMSNKIITLFQKKLYLHVLILFINILAKKD